MAKTSGASSSSAGTARRARIVVAVAAIIVLLALLSAFIWPGWAVRTAPQPTPVASSIASATPTIEAQELPEDSSDLLQVAPDHLGAYARTAVQSTDVWSQSSPIEAYQLTYSNGNAAQDITLTIAQWNTSEEAQEEYETLAKTVKGDRKASGNIRVSGETTGSYEVVVSKDDESKGTVLWRNDTVCCMMTGPLEAIETLHQIFPI